MGKKRTDLKVIVKVVNTPSEKCLDDIVKFIVNHSVDKEEE